MGFNGLLCAVVTSALLVPAGVRAEGEVDYRPGVCGGPNGSPPPKFSTLLDLPVLFLQIGLYTLGPDALYGPNDPWTNWYREKDMRKALAKLATMRTILEEGNLWDTYRFSAPPTTASTGGS